MNKINEIIKEAISQNSPLSFGKMGNVEAAHILTHLQNRPSLIGNQLFVNAGIYVDSLDNFTDWCETYLSAVKSLDCILQWCPNKEDLEIIENHWNGQEIFHSFQELEPFSLGKDGWHYNLANKRVLCVSPFPDTVRNQAQKFDKIWTGASIGEIITVKSLYSEALTGESPKPWRDKLEGLLGQIDDLDFDFATVGCGGFSLMVCDHIKKMGKPCVHLGGGNQILYGIRGKRWDSGFKEYNWYGTEHWTRPLGYETPVDQHMVEGGCYW